MSVLSFIYFTRFLFSHTLSIHYPWSSYGLSICHKYTKNDVGIFKDKENKFRFRLKSGNGQTIIASQGYTRKSSCLQGIISVKQNSQDNTNFERLRSKDGKPYFNLIAKNKLVIATSQMYSSSKAMEQGIGSVKKNSLNAEVIEIKVKTIFS